LIFEFRNHTADLTHFGRRAGSECTKTVHSHAKINCRDQWDNKILPFLWNYFKSIRTDDPDNSSQVCRRVRRLGMFLDAQSEQLRKRPALSEQFLAMRVVRSSCGQKKSLKPSVKSG
jgi:hypothetical protein